MNEQVSNYYSVIPAPIRYDKRLNAESKLLYAEITSLSLKYGYCFSSNAYLAKICEKTTRTVQRYLSKLEKCGYIHIEIEEQEIRKIYLTATLPITNCDTHDKNVMGVRQRCHGGTTEMSGEHPYYNNNHTNKFNNYNNKASPKKKKKKISSDPSNLPENDFEQLNEEIFGDIA